MAIAFRPRAAWLVTTAMMAWIPAAQAQLAAPAPAESPSPTADNLPNGDIIVTAQKRAQTLIDVPQSISIVSGAVLEQRHATSLVDYAALVPGLSLQQQNAGEARVILRGINTGGSSPTVAIYIDDTPFGSSTGQTNAAHLAGDIDPFDIERIEVLRGPQGTLYGANSLGGLLKYVTTAPKFDKLSIRAQVGVETVDGGGTGWSGNGVVNVPLGDTLAIRVSGFYRETPGYIDSLGVLGHNINHSTNYGGRASLLFNPSDRLSVRLTAVAQNIRAHGRDTVDVDAATLTPITADPFTGARGTGLLRYQTFPESNRVDYRLYSGTLEYDFGPATLTSVTSYATLIQHEDIEATQLLGDISPFYGASTPYGVDEPSNISQKKFAQEVRLTSAKSSSFEWLIGGYYTREPGQLYQLYRPFNPLTGAFLPEAGTIPQDLLGPGTPAAPLPFTHFLTAQLDSTYKEYAGFGSATWHVSHAFDITGGVRYSHNEQRTTQSLGGGFVVVQGADGTLLGSSSEGVWTWSVSPRYEINKRVAIYARVAKGYRPGGPNVVPPGAPADYPAQFRADTLISYEAGIRAETPDRTFGIDASVYYLDWKNTQITTTFQTSVGPVTADGNGEGAKSYGGEVTATLRPTRGFIVTGSLAYNHTALTGNILVGGSDGDQLPYAPRWTANVSADYDWALTDRVKAFVGGSIMAVSDRPADFDAAYQATFGRRLILDGYATVDLRAGIEMKPFTLSIYARNLANSGGQTYAGPYGSRYAGLVDVGVIRPRTIGLTAGFEF
ncbi:TonB-dependent receptor [Sphingomonas sp. AR_OL41]|uniref:TonB-dependent receptor n=1 Tax=Sphingomonas sp. AR_OL41 TaxID=3042729 RepID=UPI00247FF36E|nr:TonB-dependent receptor [Sphingomonas sp. AR_OL41]MDH7973120.1 TonB-dependent receptor [Sphingomonas sp. AR_OL41]